MQRVCTAAACITYRSVNAAVPPPAPLTAHSLYTPLPLIHQVVGSSSVGGLYLLRLDPSLLVTSIVSGARGYANGLCANARLGSLGGLAVAGDIVYVSDGANNRVRMVLGPGRARHAHGSGRGQA